MKKILGLFLGLFFFTQASAQMPTSFTYASTTPGWFRGQVTFNPAWTINPGDTLIFTPTLPWGLSDVAVVLSATQDQNGNIYKLAMGRDGGKRTSLCGNSGYGAIPGCSDIQSPLKSGTTYWAQASSDGATFAYGTGSVAGQNTIKTWTIPAGNRITPKYFGFGGWDQRIDFTNISVIKAAAAVTAAPATPAGGTAYTYKKAVQGQGTVTFAPAWTYNPGDTLVFTPTLPSGLSDVVVVLSATQDQTAPIYKLAMGRGTGAYTSLVGNAGYAAIPGCENVTVGLQSGTTYWAQVSSDGATFAYGTGSVAGQNTIKTWTIPAGNKLIPKFFGLGGWDCEVDFANISVTKATQSTIVVIGAGNPAYGGIYYSTVINSNGSAGWQGQDGTRAREFASAGNYYMHIGDNNDFFYYAGPFNPGCNWSIWKHIPGAARHVAVNSAGNLLHIGMGTAEGVGNTIYYSNTGPDASGNVNWTAMNGTNAIAIAAANGHYLHLGPDNLLWYRSGPLTTAFDWVNISGEVRAKKISITDQGKILVVDKQGTLYYADGPHAPWVKQTVTNATCVAACSIGGSTTFMYVGTDGSIWCGGAPNASGIITWYKLDGAGNGLGIAISDSTILQNYISQAATAQAAADKAAADKAAADKAAAVKAVNDQAAAITPDTKTNSFIYDPKQGTGNVTFFPNLPYHTGDVLFFTPTANWGTGSQDGQDLVVVFSATKDQTAPIFKLAVGRGMNATTSLEGTSDYQKPWGADLPGIGNTSGKKYWVQLLDDKFWFGTGDTAGQNVLGFWPKDASVPPIDASKVNPNFFGLGGWNIPITFTNISVLTEEEEELIELTVTDEFVAEPGKFKRIAAGLRNNELEAWAIDAKGNPYRYDAYAGFPYEIPSLEKKNPWEKMPLNKEIASLEDIAISQHGDIAAIDNNENTLKYDWAKKAWVILPASNKIKLARIYIADSNHIYAQSHDNILYEYDMPKAGKASWIEYKVNPEANATKCIGASVGLSLDNKNVILISISENGKAYEASTKEKEWKELTGATDLVEVTIGNEDHIFAIDKKGLLWQLDYKNKKWTPVENKDKKQCSGLSYISANAHGDLLALDSDGDNYIKEAPAKVEEAKKIAAKPAEKAVKGTAAPGEKAVATTEKKLTRAQAALVGKTKAKAVKTGKKVKAPTKKIKAKPKIKKTTIKHETKKPVTQQETKKSVVKKPATIKKPATEHVAPPAAA